MTITFGLDLQDQDLQTAVGQVTIDMVPWSVRPYETATVHLDLFNTAVPANPPTNTPQIILQGSNDPTAFSTPAAALWTNLITVAAAAPGDSFIDADQMHGQFRAYRFSVTGGHANDTITAHIYRTRKR